MLDLELLRQFVTFAECGTLSATAERIHISQPTITRTMQQIEEEFGVPLFERGKNRIALNETGAFAVSLCNMLLEEEKSIIGQVRDYDMRLHTVSVESCAPAPLWTLLPQLSKAFPQKTVSSKLVEVLEIIADVKGGRCEIGILPYAVEEKGFCSVSFLSEHLSVCVKSDHELASRRSVTLDELNGYNYLLRSEIGFWDRMCRERMPASRFLVQSDDFEFKELIRSSSLPCFSTNLSNDSDRVLEDRTVIPITDECANVTYHLFCKEEKREYLRVCESLRK